jgi:hypothetical protein
MAITKRQTQQLSGSEEAAIVEFFQTNQEFDPKFQTLNAGKMEAALFHMNAVINAESLQRAFDILKQTGELKLISPEKQKFDDSVRRGGYNQSHVNAVFSFLKTMHLVHDGSDAGLENAALVMDGLAGRDFTPASMRFAVEYAQSRGTTKLHWEDRRDPDKPARRGRHSTDEPVKFMPKDESNRGFLQGHSYSQDPRFNGQLEREKRDSAKTPWQRAEEDPGSASNQLWKSQAQGLQGNTHSETARIQRVVNSTSGGWRLAYAAGKAEQKRIENERSRGR